MIDQVSGSTGLSAAVENILALVQDGSQTVLKVLSREEESAELALRLDADIATWVLLGSADEVAKTEERQRILDLLQQEAPLPAKEIAQLLGEKEGNVKRLLRKMVRAGTIHQKTARGPYYPGNLGNFGNQDEESIE